MFHLQRSSIDWSTKNTIALASSCKQPPLFISSSGKRIKIGDSIGRERINQIYLVKPYQEELPFHPRTSSLAAAIVEASTNNQNENLQNMNNNTSSPTYNQIQLLQQLKETVLVHPDLPIHIVRWNDSGSRLATVDGMGRVAVWENEIYRNELKLKYVGSVNENILSVQWNESYRHLSFGSEKDFSDLKKRSTLGLQSLQDSTGFVLVTVSGKIYFFYEESDSYSFAFTQLNAENTTTTSSHTGLDEFPEFFEAQMVMRQFQRADIIMLPDNTCKVALQSDQDLFVFQVLHNTSFIDYDVNMAGNLITTLKLPDSQSAFSMLDHKSVLFIHHNITVESTELSLTVWTFDKEPTKTQTFTTKNLVLSSIDCHRLRTHMNRRILALGGTDGRALFIDCEQKEIIKYEWPLLASNATAITDTNPLKSGEIPETYIYQPPVSNPHRIRLPTSCICFSPNEVFVAIFSVSLPAMNSVNYLGDPAAYYTLTLHMANPSANGPKDNKYLSYVMARSLQMIYNGHDGQDFDFFIRKQKPTQTRDYESMIVQNLFRILYKNYNELTAVQYLYGKLCKSAKPSEKESLDDQIRNLHHVLKLNATLEQLLFCFQDQHSVKSILDSNSEQLNTSAKKLNTKTLFYIPPLCSWLIDLINQILRQLYTYFNLVVLNQNSSSTTSETSQTPSYANLNVGLLIFCSLGRSLLLKAIKMLSIMKKSIHELEPKNKQQEPVKAFLYQNMQDLMMRQPMKLDAVYLMLMDIHKKFVAANPTPNLFDDLCDVYIKGVIPRKLEINAIKEIIQEKISNLFELVVKQSVKSADIISPGQPVDASIIASAKQTLKSLTLMFSSATFKAHATFDAMATLNRPLGYEDRVQPHLLECIEQIQSNSDVISGFWLSGVPVIRQCQLCRQYSAGFAEKIGSFSQTSFQRASSLKRQQHELDPVLVDMMQNPPWKNMFLRQCFCGGSWMKVLDMPI